MKTIYSSIALSLAMVGAAMAADLPSRRDAPVYVPPPIPAFTWTGVYVGGNVGAAFTHVSALDVTPPSGGFFTDLVPAGTEGFGFQKTGVAGGAQAGAQYQYQSFVFGVEGGYTKMDSGKTIVSPYFPATDTLTGKIDNVVTVVGRFGYAFDRVMIYAKGGYAGGDVRFSAFDSGSIGTPVSYSQKNWQNGWAAGAGVEYALTDWARLGLDYTHIDLGSKTGTGPNIIAGVGPGANPEFFRTRASADMVMARLNFFYGFNPVAPVVARY